MGKGINVLYWNKVHTTNPQRAATRFALAQNGGIQGCTMFVEGSSRSCIQQPKTGMQRETAQWILQIPNTYVF